MWPSWLKRRATRSTPCPPPALVAAAATPSLRDIPSMLEPETAAQPPQSGASPPRVFHRLHFVASALLLLRALQPAQVAAGEEAVAGPLVLYFTSIQAIRRTFVDCTAVRDILKTLNAAVDKRDLFMHKSLASELAALLPAHRPVVTLPQLFVGGRHLGGAEEVRRLHGSGELARIVESAPAYAPPSCDRCGGERFVRCGHCNGRHGEYSGVQFLECAHCSMDGLVRCPDCFSPAA